MSKEIYGVTEGEASFRGPTSKWKRGKFRKQAEQNPVKDDNQTLEGNIREKQVRLKNAAAGEAYQRKLTNKKQGQRKRVSK